MNVYTKQKQDPQTQKTKVTVKKGKGGGGGIDQEYGINDTNYYTKYS